MHKFLLFVLLGALLQAPGCREAPSYNASTAVRTIRTTAEELPDNQSPGNEDGRIKDKSAFSAERLFINETEAGDNLQRETQTAAHADNGKRKTPGKTPGTIGSSFEENLSLNSKSTSALSPASAATDTESAIFAEVSVQMPVSVSGPDSDFSAKNSSSEEFKTPDIFPDAAGDENALTTLKAVYEVRALGQTMMESELVFSFGQKEGGQKSNGLNKTKQNQKRQKGKENAAEIPFQITTSSRARGLLGLFVNAKNIFKTEGVIREESFIPFSSFFFKGSEENMKTVRIETDEAQNIKDYQTAMLDMMRRVQENPCAGSQIVTDGKRTMRMTFTPLTIKEEEISEEDKALAPVSFKKCALKLDLLKGKKKGWFWTREEKEPLILWFAGRPVQEDFPLHLLHKAQMKAPFLGTIEIRLKTAEVF